MRREPSHDRTGRQRTRGRPYPGGICCTDHRPDNRRDEQEMSVLCLRICQAAIVYINVLMIQDVLADPDWDGVLTVEDERGLTPLFGHTYCLTARSN